MKSKQTRIARALALLISLTPLTSFATDVRVVDTSGKSSDLKDVSIDYTLYGMLYTPDMERSGVRAKQGEGVLTMRWELVEKITFAKSEDSTEDGTAERKAEVLLKSGSKKEVVLIPFSKEGLAGETELGKMSFTMDKIQTIEVTNP